MPVAKSRPVPAFYDSKPYLVPVLSSQVEITLLPERRVRISASESMILTELNIFSRTATSAETPRVATPRGKTPIATTSRAQTPREQTPAPTLRGKSVAIELPSSDSERSEGSPTPSESSLSSLESKLGASDKIPKPSGEAGRPGRGGYNLEDQLGWGEDGFKSLKRFVNKAIKKQLDTTKCRSQQDRQALDTVCNLVTAEFPDMDSFENCWPVLNLIQMRLKYLSSRAQQKKRIGDSSNGAVKGEKRREKSPKSKSPAPSKK
ncbi:hypothetical protein PISMIDRAFT_19400 [Pisolithus microcarpus 441]|uniref:Uncharacterized protein n=1 Tax=Pisolithus microcarpus 441 TaxID=765257 RepID=A0A0C9YMV7_9AGAM|nr:hypothetical protein BKA83DRAFT_19400 [Pisolithus microcarpus]KIK11577.1 hypothetical protein PISMIDRAFT_19400 [Pisolithus microcarpus 441]